MVLAVAGVGLGGLPAIAAATTLVKSTFESDKSVEGWQQKVVGEPLAAAEWWNGGNPHGAILRNIDDPSNYQFFFSAPRKFLGDKTAAYKGQLIFDENWYRVPAPSTAPGTVYLHDKAGTVLRHDLGGIPADAAWHRYKVPLTKTAWVVNSTALPPTGAEMKQVLGHLTELNILTYDSGGPTFSDFHLDNVKIKDAH